MDTACVYAAHLHIYYGANILIAQPDIVLILYMNAFANVTLLTKYTILIKARHNVVSDLDFVFFSLKQFSF